MKRKITAMLLTLAMVLSLLPMTALAAYPGVPDKLEAPVLVLSELRAPTINPDSYSDGAKILYCEVKIPQSITALNTAKPTSEPDSAEEVMFTIYHKIEGVHDGQWHNIGGDFYLSDLLAHPVAGKAGTYFCEQEAAELIGSDGKIVDYEAKAIFSYYYYDAAGEPNTAESSDSNILTNKVKASPWATAELKKADELGLVPDSLKNADLTRSITRAEFAAVAVKVYENLSGTKALPAVTNPFKDTTDIEVLKAYNAGIMVGISADKFEPNTLLNREQAATALTRVFKRVTIPGWSFATDSKYTLNFTQPAKFADDAKISDWAKPSVYFMVANKIITGVGNNMFAPKATTSAEQAANYASATREQALVIAVRMVESLAGKEADYTEGATLAATAGQLDNALMGTWQLTIAAVNVSDNGWKKISFTSDNSVVYSYATAATSGIYGSARTYNGFTGKYSVSGNKIMLTDLMRTSDNKTLSDLTITYSIGQSEGKTYLELNKFNIFDTSEALSAIEEYTKE